MDFSSFISGSDNLFKYIFTAGIAMVLSSLIYPLQKKQDIEIEIISHNKEAELLNKEISILKLEIEDFKKITKIQLDSAQYLSSLKKTSSPSNTSKITREIKEVQKNYNKIFDKLSADRQKIEVSSIIIKYNRKRIELLEEHSNVYGTYFIWLLIIGIVCSVSGVIFWSLSTIKKERLISYEIEDKKQKLSKP